MAQPDVLIVGAGPTGLVLALWLARLGVSIRIIDKSHEAGETSRAIAVSPRTLEFYRQMGFADEVVNGGINMGTVQLHRGKKVVTRFKIGNIGGTLSPYPFILAYPQDDHERLLIQHLAEHGIYVERETELISLKETTSGIEAVIQKGHETEIVQASYLCGCDGAHSMVRHQLQIGFPGGTYSQVFYVADVVAQGDIADGKLHLCVGDVDFCIVLPVRRSGSTRLIGIVPSSYEDKDNITYTDVASRIKEMTQLSIDKVNWFATYHVHHRVADHFQKGRAFLLGDAAHIHSPAGGQGMNTGIGDAVNLAWKLADVVKGRATPELLTTYAAERIPFARKLVATTDTAFKFMVNRSPLGKAWRKFLLPTLAPILTNTPLGQGWIFKTISQIGIEYRHSPLSQGIAGNLHGGDRLPWAPVNGSDNFAPLKSFDWQIQVYGKCPSALADAAARHHLAIQVFPDDEPIFAGNTFYLIRPDGYIALCADTKDPEQLDNYFASRTFLTGIGSEQ